MTKELSLDQALRKGIEAHKSGQIEEVFIAKAITPQESQRRHKRKPSRGYSSVGKKGNTL